MRTSRARAAHPARSEHRETTSRAGRCPIRPARASLRSGAVRPGRRRSRSGRAASPRSCRRELVQRVRELADPRERHRRTWIVGLTKSVDPDRRDAELVRRLDVVEEALRDVHVSTSIGPGRLVEDLPMLVSRLVRADLARDDRELEGDAERLDRCVDEVAIRVREDPELPSALVSFGRVRVARRRRPASPGATARARSSRPREASARSRRRAPRARSRAPRDTTRRDSPPGSEARARGSERGARQTSSTPKSFSSSAWMPAFQSTSVP